MQAGRVSAVTLIIENDILMFTMPVQDYSER